MNRGRTPFFRLRTVVGGLLGPLLLLGLLALDRRSLERGNRLYRAGEVTTATHLYRAKSTSRDVRGRAGYNLGTALLVLGRDEAAARLQTASAHPNTEVAQRSYYNLGYLNMAAILPSTEPDSAILLATAAVENGRSALRLDPDDQDARWNLALAQRMLDSLSAVVLNPERLGRAGDDPTQVDYTALTRADDGVGRSGLEPDDAEAAGTTGQRSGAAVGARESWTSFDPGPLTLAEARQLTTDLSDDAERLVRGILWSQRPNVAVWNSESYPGGDW